MQIVHMLVLICMCSTACMCRCVFCVFVPLLIAELHDCHFCHVCLDIFGRQLQFVGELAVRQFITKPASISVCACESVCIH